MSDDRPAHETDEIEITPEMLTVGEAVVRNWFRENGDVIYENGGTGDIHSLLTELWASWKKDV
jgi:hypothetical protein